MTLSQLGLETGDYFDIHLEKTKFGDDVSAGRGYDNRDRDRDRGGRGNSRNDYRGGGHGHDYRGRGNDNYSRNR